MKKNIGDELSPTIFVGAPDFFLVQRLIAQCKKKRGKTAAAKLTVSFNNQQPLRRLCAQFVFFTATSIFLGEFSLCYGM